MGESDYKLLAILMVIENETDRHKATEIYIKYYSTMMYVAKSILTDSALAEDAVSEALIKIIDNLDKISDISCYKTRSYIVIIVRNIALNQLKKQLNRKEDITDIFDNVPDSDISILDKMTNVESCELIIKAIRSLPKTLSDVLYLSVVFGYDNATISQLLDISYDVAKSRLSRAKKAIRKILSETGDNYGIPVRKDI